MATTIYKKQGRRYVEIGNLEGKGLHDVIQAGIDVLIQAVKEGT